MSATYKERFYKKLEDMGLCADTADLLSSNGLLTEALCERALIRMEFAERKGKNKKTVYGIISDLSDEFKKSYKSIEWIVYDRCERTCVRP